MNPDTLPALLAQRINSASPAMFDRGRPVSYRELDDESARLAQGLRKLGVRAGDCVALWLPNLPAWLAVFFGCARLGAIAVSVNTRFRSHELADILRRSRARVLVFWPEFKGIDFAGILAGCDAQALAALEAVIAYDESGAPAPAAVLGKPAHSYAALASSAAPLPASEASPQAGCAIFTTSGTTKAPKFVLHDQRTVLSHAFDVARGFALDADATLLLAPPLCGVFGFCGALASIAAGRPFVLTPAWQPEQAAAGLVAHRVTHAIGTDEACAQLLDCGADVSRLRFFGYAAFSPAQGDIVQRADAKGLKLVGLYGASEIQALFSRQDERAPIADRMQGGGWPVSAAARVRVRDPESGELLPHGAQGELEFLAPGSRMVAYHGNAEATRAAFTADGYYRSGDLGSTLADGRFVYLARMGDALRLGGFLVSPAEIESVVQEAPGIAACQVVGVPRAEGLVPIAFVVLQPGAALDEQAVVAFVAARLARYKVPRRVFPVDAFPVTPGANATKIQKGKLREMAEALLH